MLGALIPHPQLIAQDYYATIPFAHADAAKELVVFGLEPLKRDGGHKLETAGLLLDAVLKIGGASIPIIQQVIGSVILAQLGFTS